MRLRLLVAPCLLLSAAIGCGDSGPTPLGRSIQRFCDIATEVDADPSLEPVERATEVASRAQAEIHDAEFARLMASMATSSPDSRSRTLREAARANGLGDSWSCPALD